MHCVFDQIKIILSVGIDNVYELVQFSSGLFNSFIQKFSIYKSTFTIMIYYY